MTSKDTRVKKVFRRVEWLADKSFQVFGKLLLVAIAIAFITGPYLMWFLPDRSDHNIYTGFYEVGSILLWVCQAMLVIMLGIHLFDKVHRWAHDV